MIPDGALCPLPQHNACTLCIGSRPGDRATHGTHASAIERKLTRYRAAYNACAERHYATLFSCPLVGFRILFLVPTSQRARAIVTLAARLDLAPLVWVATHDVLALPGDLSAPVWLVHEHEPKHCLSE